jgi:hypothetical protein
MNNRIVVVFKSSTKKDLFLDNHDIAIRGRIPGFDETLWSVHNIDNLPSAIVVNIPDDVKGNFYLKFFIRNKANGNAVFKSTKILYLNINTMKDRFKIVDFARKL